MTESLEIIVEMIAIVSFCAGVVNYVVIKPLRLSIDTLTLAVEKLEKLLHKVEDDEQQLRTRIELHEQAIETLTDTVEKLAEYHKQPVKG